MLFDDTYKTIAAPGEGIYKDRGSRFIGYAFPVTSEDEIKMHVGRLKKEHSGARHHCFAFRLGADKMHFRSNDDGEPAGSAGKPILGQIQSHDVTNILIVVVRYFGGTLLGVPGLIAAYRGAAAAALANTTIVEKQIMETYSIQFSYESMNAVMKILKEDELEQRDQDFQLACRLTFSVRKRDADRILEQLKKISKVELRSR
jgi:uncharacterized YigZ family protein